MARYDEDLHENLFFQTLVGKFAGLFTEAAENRWLICVPRYDVVSRLKLGRTDFENHILKPVGTQHSKQFISLNNKHVMIDGDVVKVGQGYREQRMVKILFDECFFNSREESYQVFCLEQALEGGATGDEVAVTTLESLDDCSKFLWSEPGSEKARKSVDRLLLIFQIESGTLRPIMDAAAAVYTRAVQEAYRLRKFQLQSQRNFCKLAVETYVMAGLHGKIFKEICFLVANKDAEMNKITRNLSDTHPQYLGIKPQFRRHSHSLASWGGGGRPSYHHCQVPSSLRLSLPEARKTLSQLNQFITPLDKLCCFKRCIETLTQMPLEGTCEALTADELLPILVYLVIICDIPNWTGNLTYINKFHFSNVGMEEFAYYLTSFEAAVEYVRKEAVAQFGSMNSSIAMDAMQRLRSSSTLTEDGTSAINKFFQSVCEGDIASTRGLLEQAQQEADATKALLCHPLCTCEKCTALENSQLDDSHRVTVYCRDEEGRTGLHHAARMGHTEVVHLLLEHRAIVSATDHHSSTPLHFACQKGHQKCTLLLLGEGCSVNIPDNSGNTPLHLACSNGHEECVKALLFHKVKCEVNVTNEQRDTPLHNAARWGYASIVAVLLEHGASTNLTNRRAEVPSQCAQSRKVQELLSSYTAKKRVSIILKDEAEAASAGDHKTPSKNLRPRKKSESKGERERQFKKLFRAIQDNDINYVRYLFGWQEGDPPTLCHPLCQCEKCSQLRKTPAASSGLTVDSYDPYGQTALHKAALQGHHKMVELLMAHGTSIDVRTKEQLTPLHLACQYNHKDVVLILLEHGAQINPQDAQGNTPLHFTCNNGHIESATILLIHGADLTVANNRGDTALHSAARWNHPMLVNELLLYGAQYSVMNGSNKTPLDLTKDEEVQAILQQAMQGLIAVGSYRKPLRGADQIQAPDEEEGVRTTRSAENTPLTIQKSSRPKSHSVNTGQPPTSTTPPKIAKQVRLEGLLRAIESYDRASSLRHSETDDRSAPMLQPDPELRDWLLYTDEDFDTL